jgi:beta propeller repeat protein
LDEYGYPIGNWDIYMYDLSTRKEKRITTNPSASLYPAIYGNRIVWEDSRNGNDNIYMYDVSTSKETQITTSGSASDPAIYGDRIVYFDYRDGKDGTFNIYMYDLSTKKETQIVNSWRGVYNPAIYGDRIVWEDSRNDDGTGNTDIYMYDLSTKKETRITPSYEGGEDNPYQLNPEIYGNKIVWWDARNYDLAGWDIYMYDLSTKKETRITTNKSDQATPDIYGNRIVWMDGRNGGGSVGEYQRPIGNWNIYIYDFSTHTEPHTTDRSSQQFPAINGDRIVWQDNRSGNWDIYMGTLSTSPVAAFSASPTSGKAPLKVTFTDKSTGSPTSWKWSFGDKTYSTAKNPVHKYTAAGKYTVSLTVKNAAGSNTKTMTGYIKVSKK